VHREGGLLTIHSPSEKESSRKLLARAIGNGEAPGLFTEGFYRYSLRAPGLSAWPSSASTDGYATLFPKE
jgi:hypothetical protein